MIPVPGPASVPVGAKLLEGNGVEGLDDGNGLFGFEGNGLEDGNGFCVGMPVV